MLDKDEPQEIELEEESEASIRERKSREWDARQKAYQDDSNLRGYP